MSSAQKPKLADRLRAALRLRGYAYRTEPAYAQSNIQRAIAAAVKRAGFRKRVTAHTLRAAFAHRLAESGASTADIQSLMGHVDPKTTAHYLAGLPPAHTRLRGPLAGK